MSKCKFIFNNKELYGKLKISETGLKDLSKITVLVTQTLIGA